MKVVRNNNSACIKKFCSRIFFGVLLSLLLTVEYGYTLRVPEKKRVLLLNSYHRGLEWTDNITHTIEEIFRKYGNVELFVEYMDTKRIADENYFKKLFDIYKYKYKNRKFDVIITSDDHAFNFILKYRDKLFPNVPVVFCGVNYFNDAKLAGYNNITGVVESFDIRSTLNIALKNHPSAERLFIINDRTVTGQANKKVINEILPDFTNRVKVHFLEDLDMSELLKLLSHLKKNDLVLLMSFNRDKSGQIFSYKQSIDLIARACHVPIYGIWEFYLGKGIVGGMITSGTEQGRLAARMALRILDGEDANSIPVIRKSPNRFMFDYNMLQRFGLEVSSLPKRSIIINKPVLFYKIPKHLFQIILIGLAIFALLIVLLLLSIHRRKVIELRLRESEEKYRKLVESANDAIVIADAETGQIIDVNNQAEKLWGYTRDELIGRYQYELHPPEDKEMYQNIFKAHVMAKKARRGDIYIINKSGQKIPVEVSASVVDVGGRKIIQGIFRDMTERKKAEEALKKAYDELERKVEERTREIREKNILLQRQYEEIIKANRMKNEFLANVSHELRTPLNSILGFSQILLNDMEGKLTAKQKEDIAIIYRNGRHLLNLINDILDLSKIEAGKVELNFEYIDVAKVIPEVVEELRPIAEGKGLQMQVVLEQDLPEIYVDYVRFKQVLYNLINNSIKFTESGGVTVSAAKRKNELIIEVRDTGCGISREQLENIFDPFIQFRRENERKPEGTGLGLAITKHYVELMNGRIEVESEVGKGSVFRLIFPYKRKRKQK